MSIPESLDQSRVVGKLVLGFSVEVELLIMVDLPISLLGPHRILTHVVRNVELFETFGKDGILDSIATDPFNGP